MNGIQLNRAAHFLSMIVIFLSPHAFHHVIRFLQSSMFHSESTNADALGRSTSTANTTRARHDHLADDFPSDPQQVPMDRKKDRYTDYGSGTSSSSQSSRGHSVLALDAQFSAPPPHPTSSSFKSLSGMISEMAGREEVLREEDIDPQVMSARLHGGTARVTNDKTGNNEGSIDSFEAFFEDEDSQETDESEDYSLHWVKSTVPKSLSEEVDTASVQSSKALHVDTEDSRECEVDDNMSAITWPDLTSKKIGAHHGKATQDDDDVEETIAEQEAEENVEVVERGDSVDGVEDSFLLELDVLSLSWMQRRKTLDEKEGRSGKY